MRAVVTRVNHAAVAIGGETVGRIGQGFLVLLGVTHDDTEAQARKLADKICSLRIFEDEAGKMNIGLDQVGGELLIVSQFTLYGSCRRGRRPAGDRHPPLRNIRGPVPGEGLPHGDRPVRRRHAGDIGKRRPPDADPGHRRLMMNTR